MKDLKKEITLDLENMVDPNHKTWFAIQTDDDNEAGYGTNSLKKAVDMAIAEFDDEYVECVRIALFFDDDDEDCQHECYNSAEYHKGGDTDDKR